MSPTVSILPCCFLLTGREGQGRTGQGRAGWDGTAWDDMGQTDRQTDRQVLTFEIGVVAQQSTRFESLSVTSTFHFIP